MTKSPVVDLNVPWPQENYGTPITPRALVELKNTLATLCVLGYTHVALNFTLSHSTKVPTASNPIDLSLLKEFEDRLKLYTRVTIVIDEPSQGQSISKLQNAFDIVAVLPTSEKGLLMACASLDIDILTFEYTKRLPTFLKHKSIGAAVKRGVKLEVVYSKLFGEFKAQFMSNTMNVLRASRAQNIVISSGALRPVECRAYRDIFNVLELLGFKRNMEQQCQEKACKVLLSGRLRIRSYKQTVAIGEDVVDDTKGLKRNLKDITGGDVFKAQLKRLKENK
jgi:ribonuclease P/MRP protein subunit RPP1